MADASPQAADPLRAEFRRMVEGGVPVEQAIAKIKEFKAKSQTKPSMLESVGLGALHGASLGFADEIGAGAEALGRKVGGLFSGIDRPLAENYRSLRDENRTAFKTAEDANPKTYTAASIAGSLPTALALGGAPTTLGASLASGAGVGAAQSLGSSEADLTKGNIAGAAKDTAIGGALGAAGAGIGYGIAKGAGKVADKVFPSRRTAAEVAKKATSAADAADETTVKSMLSQADDLERAAQQKYGESIQLSPGQASGQRSVLLKESAAAQVPGRMDVAQKMQGERLKSAERMYNKFVEHAAASPEALGNSNVGAGITQAHENFVKQIAAERSAVGGRLFKDAAEAGADMPLVPIGKLRSAVSELEDSLGSEVVPAIRKELLKADEAGTVTIESAQRMLSHLSNSDLPAMKGITDAQNSFVRRQLRTAIDAGMDEAGTVTDTVGPSLAGRAKEAVDKLREARRVWGEFSGKIDEVNSNTARKILKLSDNDAADKIVSKIMSNDVSEQQVSSLVKTLTSAGDDGSTALKNLRAQVVLNMVNDSGGGGGKAIASSIPDEGISAAQLRNFIKKGGNKLKSLYADDPQAFSDLQELYHLTERLALTPRLHGAQTAPIEAAIANIAQSTKSGLGQSASDYMRKVVESKILGKEGIARALATPDGIAATRDLMRARVTGVDTDAGMKAMVKAVGAIVAANSDYASEKLGGSTRP